MDEAFLATIQKSLAQRVRIPPENLGSPLQPEHIVFGLDAQYVKDRAFVGLDVRTWGGEHLGIYVASARIDVPYVPQYFCFREGPPLLAMIRAAKGRLSVEPDLIVVDGHGVAHPRRFGLACWIGVYTDTATIGCAKKSLLPWQGKTGQSRGHCQPIRDKGQTVGAALVTRDGTKPVFVSPGHRVGLRTSVEVILALSPAYRICEPLRNAHQGAKAAAQGRTPGERTFWGALT